MSAIADTGAAEKDTGGPVRPPRGRAHGLLSRVPEGFAVFFGALGLLCALLAVIPPLRTGLRPLVRFLDLLLVPVSANLAYAVFLFLLAAATGARKKIAWWLVVVYLSLLVLTDILGMAIGEFAESVPSFVVCGLALILLIVARGEFYAASRRAAVRRALAVLLAGLVVAVLAGWALVEAFPGTLPGDQRLAWAANRVLRRPRARGQLRRPPAARAVLPARPVRRARPAQRRRHPVPLPAPGSRPARRRGGPHPRPPRPLRRPGLPRLLRHPPRQGRRLLTQRQGRRHLPRRGRGVPGQRRPGRRPGGLAPRDRRLAGRGPPVRLGTGGDGRLRRRARRPSCAPGSARSSSATKRSCTSSTSTSTAATCASPARPSTASAAPAPPAASAATPPSPRTEMAADRRTGRRLARHRDRTRLLHGPGPARRPGRRRLPPRGGPRRGRPSSSPCCPSCPGAGTASPWT